VKASTQAGAKTKTKEVISDHIKKIDDNMEMAIQAIRKGDVIAAEDIRKLFNLDINILAAYAACEGAVEYANVLIMRGANTQAVLDGAFCGGNIKFAEELLFQMKNDQIEPADVSKALFNARRAECFTDNKSGLRLLSGFQSLYMRGMIVHILELGGRLIFSGQDIHKRLQYIFDNMSKNLDFDTVYQNMLQQFDRPAQSGYPQRGFVQHCW
jgi:hypothetical protein